MNPKRTLRHVGIALMLLVAFLVQGTWALAGTTGNLSGTILDEKAAPVVGATVTASAPSGTSTTATDGTGHFVFLNLAPDTYTVSAKKDGYNPISQGGVSVFADQTQTLELKTEHSIKEIGHVTSKAANDLVKSGTTADIYSVNAATAEKVASIGGGTNLNNAYSALASQPGVMVDYGGVGWGQTIYIHGASYSQVGYEFDGIPVNRAFDNYNANTLTNLGQQELQVYTGGAPASDTTSSVGGFINQVIRTGTYPGFGNVSFGVGAPSYGHTLQGEAGGATPNRLFSYYVGLLGYDVAGRFVDQYDGGSGPGFGVIPNVNTGPDATFEPGGVFALCGTPAQNVPDGTGLPGPLGYPGGCLGILPFAFGATSALVQDRESVANFHIGIPHKRDSGRDDVQLLYSGSYQHETFRDSINDYGGYTNASFQLFGTPDVTGNGFFPYADAQFFNNNASFGQTLTPGQTIPLVNYLFPSSPTNRAFGSQLPYNGAGRAGQSNDSQIIKAQYTHNIGSNAYLRVYGYTFYSDWLLNDPTVAELVYRVGNGYFGSTPDYELITHTKGGAIQYANQINSKNLLQADVTYVTADVARFNNSSFRANGGGRGGLYNGATDLVQLDASGNPIMDGLHCVDYSTGALGSCFGNLPNTFGGTRGQTQGTFVNPTQVNACGPKHNMPCPNFPNTQWVVTNLGPAGTLNKVTPKFGSFSISDEWRPTDKLLIDIGLRGDRFEYDLTPTDSNAFKFWFNAAANSFCYDPAQANFPAQNPSFLAGSPVPAGGALIGTAPGQPCPNSPVTGLPELHPNGSTGPGSGNPAGSSPVTYTSHSNASNVIQRLEGRLSGTYTESPDTVWRFAAGQYVNPFNTATQQYTDASPKRAAYNDFLSFIGLGFTGPEHDVQPTISTNYDLSLERRIRGTDVSFKLSPFYRDVHNQTQDSFIGPGFVSAIPTNNERAWGVEFQLNKGDPNKNGLSGQLSYTWTRADSKFNQLGNGQNFIDTVNGSVGAYNALTKAGSGTTFTLSNGKVVTLGTAAPCYLGGVADTADCTVVGNTIVMTPGGLAAGAVQNPYFFLNPQGYFDPAGRYPLYQSFPNIFENAGSVDSNMSITWPSVFAGFLNYKHNKFSIAPNFQLIYGYSGGSTGGGNYGSPFSVVGVDPRACGNNQAHAADSHGNPIMVPPAFQQLPFYPSCAGSPFGAGALYIPDPYTGSFDSFGKFANPWLLNVNAQISYELTPKVKATLILANIYNRCFGGSKTPWATASPPGSTVCGYDSNGLFAGAPGLTPPGTGFFVGDSPSNAALNGAPFSNSAAFFPYQPLTSFLPFNAYLTLQFKI